MLHYEEQIDTDYTTPLIRDEFEYSKTVKLINGTTYNPTELRGFFTHGIHNNLETFIEIIKDKYILPRNCKTSSVNTLTIKYSINTRVVSVSTITTKFDVYAIYGEMGITFITNKLYDGEFYNYRSNMSNEFFVKELKVTDCALLLDEKLKTIKIKELQLLQKLNQYDLDYKNVIRRKILFLIKEYSVEDIINDKLVNETDDVKKLKEFYYIIIGKIFGEKTFLEVIMEILVSNGIEIPVIFLNYPIISNNFRY
jgi:hypothetical protein